jgi:NADH-quinone oxidoreductase subunit N
MTVILILFAFTIINLFLSLSKFHRYIRLSSILAIILAFLSLVFPFISFSGFENFFEFNQISIIFSLVSLVLTFFIFINKHLEDLEDENENDSFFILILFSLIGAHIVYGFTNLLTLFLGIEIFSIPIYILAAQKSKSQSSPVVGLKYFILGALSTAFMVFGIALIYGGTGFLDFQQSQQIISNLGVTNFYIIGIIMMFSALFFKIAVAPFHFWISEIYLGSPTSAVMYMATLVKLVVASAFLYLIKAFFLMSFEATIPLIEFVAVISLLVGNILGLKARNLKTLLAYSSIAHSAYILLALISVESVYLLTLYISVYVFNVLGLFIGLYHLGKLTQNYEFESLKGLYMRHPIFSILFTLLVLSIAGIPILPGFFTKYLVLLSIYSLHKGLFFIALLSAAISVFYYIKIIIPIYSGKRFEFDGRIRSHYTANVSMLLLLLLSFVAILIQVK